MAIFSFMVLNLIFWLQNKLSRVGAAAAYLRAAAAYLCAAAAYLIYNDNRANSASWAGLGLSLAIVPISIKL